MTAKENFKNEIKTLNDSKKYTGNVGLYRRLSTLKHFCSKHNKSNEMQKIIDELKDIDLLDGKGLEKLSKLDDLQKEAIEIATLDFDFESAKKTLLACINSCEVYNKETPERGLTNEGVYKDFKYQKLLFTTRLNKSKELQEKLDNGEISKKGFIAGVNDIKRAIVGTVKELKSYGFLKKKDVVKESMFNY